MSSKRITRTCEVCGTPFQVWASRAAEGYGLYCSRRCYLQSRPQRIACVCDTCGASFDRAPTAIMKTGTYCSRACWWTAHGVTRESTAERLLSKRKIDPVTGCWNWTGLISPRTGYGSVSLKDHARSVHRVAAWVWKGFDIECRLNVLHRCDNRRCFNPDHLFIGTPADNSADMAAKGRAAKGEGNANAKLTRDDVLRIRALLGNGMSARSIASQFGVSPDAVRHIQHGRTWTHV